MNTTPQFWLQFPSDGIQAIYVLAGLLAMWGVTHAWLLPRVRRNWGHQNLVKKMGCAGLIAVLEKVRDAAAVAMGTIILLLSLVVICELLGRDYADVVLNAITKWRREAESESESYAAYLDFAMLGATFILSTAMLWMLHKTAGRHVHAVWRRKTDEIHQRVLRDPGSLEVSGEDEGLRTAADRVKKRAHALNAAARAPAAKLAVLRSKLDEAVWDLARKMAAQKLALADLVRSRSGSDSAHGGRPNGIRGVLVSKQALADIDLAQKALEALVTAWLTLNLFVWAAEPLDTSTRLAVNALRAHLQDKDAQKQLSFAFSREREKASPPSPPVTSDDSDVQEATRIIARAAVRDMVRRTLPTFAPAEHNAPALTVEFVRATLAGRQMDPPSAALDPVGTDYAEMAKAIRGGAVPQAAPKAVQAVARRLEEPVREWRRLQPVQFREWLAQLRSRYAEPAAPVDVWSWLAGKLVEHAFDASGATDRLDGKGAAAFGEGAIREWTYANANDRLTAEILGSMPPHRNGLRASPRISAELDRFARVVGSRPNSSAAEQKEKEAADAVAKEVAKNVSGTTVESPEGAMRRLRGFTERFPLAELGLATSSKNPPSQRSQRATDFAAASRSIDVGGVVIGQPLAGTPLAVSDIRWRKVEPNEGASAVTRFAVDLHVDNGGGGGPVWLEAGRFQAGVLNQALRYAADRRVVAVTITQGDGQLIREAVALHPTLVDTPLGCRLIEADRWVNNFTRDDHDAPAGPLKDLALDRQEMRRWLHSVRRAGEVAQNHKQICSEGGHIDTTGLRGVKFKRSTDEALKRFVQDKAGSFSKPNWLQRASECAKVGAGHLRGCWCGAVMPNGLPTEYWLPEAHASQLRERAGQLDANLNWLSPSSDALGHMDFWVHAVFSLRRQGKSNADEDETRAFDFPKEQLLALRTAIEQGLDQRLREVMRSPSAHEFLAPIEEFILGQRLARAALEGHLGRDFPVLKLLELHQLTDSFVQRQPTERWSVAQESADKADALTSVLERANAHAADRFKAHRDDVGTRQEEGWPVCAAASK